MLLKDYSPRLRTIALAFALSFLNQQLQSAPPTTPSGGKFAFGSGAITGSGNALTINQSSAKGIINWNSFSIGKGGWVSFNNGSGATLNRVTGRDMSSILGNLVSSGSVYLINPQGVLIGPGAHVNTGGDFVASTLNIANNDFLANPYVFMGDSHSVVANLGSVFSKSGSIFLIGHDVSNRGQLRAANGSVGLAAASELLLKDSTTDGRIFIKAPGGDVTNTGQISAAQAELRSKGGNIYALAGNDGGQISATGTAKINGQAWLIADGGKATVAGKVTAQQADGTGGSIETSGHDLDIAGAKVSTGHGGLWLLDPVDMTIDAATAASISNSLATTFIEVMTTANSASGPGIQTAGNGDINVNSSISWPGLGTTLVLSAYRNVNINNATFSSSAAANLELRSDNAASGTGTVNIAGNSSLGNFAGAISIYYHPNSYTSPTDYSSHAPVGGTLHSYMNVNNGNELQHVQDNLSGSFGLNAEIDLSSVPNFTPIGSSSTPFSGTFEGEGHNITNLSINSFAYDVGFFGANSGTLRHFGVDSGAVVAGGTYGGGIVGHNTGTVDQVSYRGLVKGGLMNGGLVGHNSGAISDSYAQGSLNGSDGGGLVGFNDTTGTITTSYSTVLASKGLVGSNLGSVTDAYWDTNNSGTTNSQGGTGLTRFALQSALPANFSAHVWSLATNYYPVLKAGSYEFGGSSNIAGNLYQNQSQLLGISNQTIQAIVNGTSLGHTAITGADGYYNFYLPNTALPVNSNVVTYLPPGGNNKGISSLNNFQHAGYLPITNNYVTLQSAQVDLTSIVGSLKTTLGSFIFNPALLLSINSSNQLNLSGSRASLDLIGNGSTLVLDQPIIAGGLVLESLASQLAVTQTSPITVNQLSLLGGNNTFNLPNASNSVYTVAASPGRNAVQIQNLVLPGPPIIDTAVSRETRSIPNSLTQQTGSLDLFASGNLHIGNTDAASGIYEATHAKVTANSSLYIDNGISAGVEADGSGDALVLATGASFFNQSGFGVASLKAPSGRWLVWSNNPAQDRRGGINYGFKQYNATYGVTTPAESNTNGVLYRLAPVLNPAIPNISKQYDSTATASIDPTSYTATGAVDSDSVTITGPSTGTYDTKNVGISKTVTVTGLSDSAIDSQTTHIYGYQLNPTLVATGVGTITQAPLSLGIIANNKTYDGNTAAIGQPGLFTGLFVGDQVTVSGTGTYTFADKNAALGKLVTASGLGISGADAANYHFSVQTTLADIAKAPLTQSFTVGSKVYDTTTNATGTLLGSASAPLSGETVAVSGTASFQFADKNAGTAKTVYGSGLTLSGADASNYVVAYVESGTADIMPALLSGSFVASNKVYDGTTSATAMLGGLSGILGGDSLSVAAVAYNFTDKNAGAGKSVGASGITLAGPDGGNYTLALSQSGAAAITPALLTETFTANNKVYDGGTIATAALGNVSGVLALDSVAITGNAAYNFVDKNAGIGKSVTAAGLGLSGADAGNYSLTLVQAGTANITPAQLLYVANTGYERGFGADNPALSGGVTGLLGGDTLSSIATGVPVFTSPASNASTAGAYSVLGSGLSLTTGNYLLAQAPGNFNALTVNPISITIGSFSRTSTQPNPTFTASAAGAASSYLQSLLLGLTLVTNAPANNAPGVYQITAVLTPALVANLIVQPGTLTITAAAPVTNGPPSTEPDFPASLQTVAPLPPAFLPGLAIGDELLPSNAGGSFQISIVPRPECLATQNVCSTGPNLSWASFTDSSPDGRTTDHKSTYAAGAHK